MSARRPTSNAPIASPKAVVLAPPEVAMRNTCAGVGTSSAIPGTRWARSTMRISCSMSRSSLIPASSMPIAVLTPLASSTLSAATPERSRKFDEQLWQMQVPVSHRKRIGDPHPDVFIGADRLVGPLVDIGELAGDPALQVLHRGDPGRDHLKGGIERVEIEVEVARHHAGDEPQLQRHVRRA